MSSKLDQDLDSIIKSNRGNNGNRRGGRGGGNRNNGGPRRNNNNNFRNNNNNNNNRRNPNDTPYNPLSRDDQDNEGGQGGYGKAGGDRGSFRRRASGPYQSPAMKPAPQPRMQPDESEWKHDLYRQTNQVTKVVRSAGYKVRITNLADDMTVTELQDIFSSVGEISSAEILTDDNGKSKGIAEIVFGNREDAEKAVSEYHEAEVDGRPMSVQAVGSFKPTVVREAAPSGKPSYFGNPAQSQPLPPPQFQERPRFVEHNNGFNGGNNNGQRGGGFRRNNNGGNRNGGGFRPRNTNRRPQQQQQQRKSRTAVSSEDLDKELEDYHKPAEAPSN